MPSDGGTVRHVQAVSCGVRPGQSRPGGCCLPGGWEEWRAGVPFWFAASVGLPLQQEGFAATALGL